MKIIAICGENIASLSGSFRVEFDSQPLKEHGLVAITGKTGSGKSTLLDCLCLALYEQVPRFAQESRTVEIGGEEQAERLKANDVRNLVSRGQAHAFAEVAFIGGDGKHYIAKWQVRRARNQVNGRWQSSTRELVDCQTNQPFSANKREFQQHLNELIGLDYEQFRRSVMLAQGDFAAFLKAPEEQRSSLLERMTGTALYSRISQQVYEDYKQQASVLSSLQEQMEHLELLDDEARSQLEEQLKAEQQTLTQLESVIQLQRRHREQILELDRLNEARRQAEQHLQTHQQQQNEMDELQQILARLSEIEPLRENWQSRKRLTESIDQANQQLSELNYKQQDVAGQLKTSEQSRDEAAHILSEFQQQCRDRQEEVDKARGIAQQQQILSEQSEQLIPELKVREQEHQKQQSIHKEFGLRQQQFEQQIPVLEHWLKEHANEAGWGTQLPAIEQQLNRFFEQLQGMDYQQQLSHKRVQLQKQIEQRQYEQQRLKLHQNELEKNFNELPDPLADGELLREQYQRKIVALEQLQQQYNQLQQAMAWIQSQQQAVSEQSEIVTHQNMIQAELEQSTIAMNDVSQRLQEVESQYQAARQVIDLADYRMQLRDGQACPLCGSEHHPYREHQDDLPAVTILQQLQHRRDLLQGQANQLEAQQLSYQRQQPYFMKQYQQAGEKVALLEQQLSTLSLQWPDNMDRLHYLEQQLMFVGQQGERQQQQLEQLQQQWQQQDQLRQHRDELASQLQQIKQAMVQSQHDLELLNQQTGQLDEEVSLWQQRLMTQEALAQLQEQLDHQLGDIHWQSVVRQNGLSVLLQLLSDQAHQYHQQEQATNDLKNQQQELIVLSKQQQLKIDHAWENLQQIVMKQQYLQDELMKLEQQAKSLLDGQSVANWLEKTHQLEVCYQRQLDQAKEACQRCEKDKIALDTRCQTLSEELEQHRLSLQTLRTSWELLLKAHQVQEDECNHLLSLEHQKIHEMELQLRHYHNRLIELTEQLRHCEQTHQWQLTQVEEQQHELEHQLKALDLTQVAELEQLSQCISEQIYQLRSQLDKNEQAFEQDKRLRERYQHQLVEYETWDQLNQLIGSANGAKFRTFAQQLTLDKLLYEANHQLTDLAPRYRLQRIPGQALALQVVDQDMGDEIRALASLSGGETFLVSLALALALSAVSSRNLQIQSLFIDEGFGSLDPDSLDLVLGCLDKLQASGRQVMAISHVQAMVERISAKIQLHALGGGRSCLEVVD
ncbi:MAG: hypothetical protein CENE_03727 [Candidatus Celerinatantimonas neptuna]|nr:MAG: hypothetical protein CENE_03727 [Candidatus Celerinatantimonas neptuna]